MITLEFFNTKEEAEAFLFGLNYVAVGESFDEDEEE